MLFLTGVVLVKADYVQQDVGLFESFLFLSGLFTFFWVSGSMNTLMARWHQESSESQGVLLYNVLLWLFGLVLTAVVLLILFIALFDYGDHEIIIADYHPLLCLYVVFNAPGHLAEYILLLKKRNAELPVYGLFVYGFQLVLIALAAYLGADLKTLLSILVAFAFIRFAISLLLVALYGNAQFDRGTFQSFGLQAFPLILAFFFSGSADYVDSGLVRFTSTDEQFALFRFGARELPFALILANALSSAAIPAISEQLENGLKTLHLKSKQLMYLVFPLGIVLMLSSDLLFPFVFSSDYLMSARIFDCYLLLIIPRLIFPQTVLTAIGDTRWITKSALIELILNVLLSLVLYSQFGFVGIAFATFIAFSFDKLFLTKVLYGKHGISLAQICPLRHYLILSLALLGVFLLKLLWLS